MAQSGGMTGQGGHRQAGRRAGEEEEEGTTETGKEGPADASGEHGKQRPPCEHRCAYPPVTQLPADPSETGKRMLP